MFSFSSLIWDNVVLFNSFYSICFIWFFKYWYKLDFVSPLLNIIDFFFFNSWPIPFWLLKLICKFVFCCMIEFFFYCTFDVYANERSILLVPWFAGLTCKNFLNAKQPLTVSERVESEGENTSFTSKSSTSISMFFFFIEKPTQNLTTKILEFWLIPTNTIFLCLKDQQNIVKKWKKVSLIF